MCESQSVRFQYFKGVQQDWKWWHTETKVAGRYSKVTSVMMRMVAESLRIILPSSSACFVILLTSTVLCDCSCCSIYWMVSYATVAGMLQ